MIGGGLERQGGQFRIDQRRFRTLADEAVQAAVGGLMGLGALVEIVFVVEDQAFVSPVWMPFCSM